MMAPAWVPILFGLVLTEVGANPPGPESGAGSPGDRYEFVEIWNPGPDTQNLAGLWLDDGDEADSLVAWQDSALLSRFPGVQIGTLRLPPGAYAVVLDPEIVDSLEDAPFALPPGTVVLRPQDTDLGDGLAATDPVGLRDATGWLSTYGLGAGWADTVLLNPPDGVSVERRDPLGPDDPRNFRLCRWQSTPGRRNSWSLEHDLGFLADSLRTVPLFPTTDESLSLWISVRNYGLADASTLVSLRFGDKTLSFQVSLASDAEHRFRIALGVPGEGVVPLRMVLEPDEYPHNDTVRRVLVVDLGPVVINEVQPRGEVEWVELWNATDTTVFLEGWHLRDASGARSAPLSLTLLPGGFGVLAESAQFGALWPGVSYQVVASWPRLNDAGDTLYLCDSLGVAWDAVPYGHQGSATQSLERVSPYRPARFSWNWQPCQDSAGGTPGRQNTAFVDPGALSRSFEILEPVVRAGDRVVLAYRLPSALEDLEISVFDGAGRRLGQVFSGQQMGTFGTASWPAPDAPGLYIVLVKYRSGGRRRVFKTTFVVQP